MAVQKPNIVWRGCNNYWPGRDGNQVLAIVNHIMQGTEESSDGWFKNTISQVSAHFGVAKDGRIWQWVKLEDSAWANGIEEQEDKSIPWIAWADEHKVNLNRVTISIEHEGNTGEPMPETQYQATLALHRWLLATYNIPADRNHINGHYQIAAKSRPNCPGSAFPWTRLISDLAGAGAQPATPSSNIPAGMVPLSNPNKLDIYQDAWSDPESGLIVLQPFANFYRDNGGLEKFGRPKSGLYGTTGSVEQDFKYAHFYVDQNTKKVIAQMKDRNNPEGFDVGPGMLAKARELGFEMLTNEEFFIADPAKPQPGLGKLSLAWAADPASAGAVHIFMAIEHPEQKQPDGSVPWEVKVVKEEV